MNDELTSITTVQTALEEYKKSVVVLNETISELETNKAKFNSSYKSENASALINNYDQLITSLTAAYASLNSYQKKIDGVVQEIIGFDQTLQKEE